MIFDKKKLKCANCNSQIDKKFSYCPYCSYSLIDKEKEVRDFGLLGKRDEQLSTPVIGGGSMGLTDKIVSSIMNSIMKSLEKQFQQMDKNFSKEFMSSMGNAEIRPLPNGIAIKISPQANQEQKQPKPKETKRTLSQEQLNKITALPKEKAKTSLKRLNNKLVYELATPGVSTLEDVFVSKLESGYEIKAIGSKKIYVNSLSVELPLKSYALAKDKLVLEFKTN